MSYASVGEDAMREGVESGYKRRGRVALLADEVVETPALGASMRRLERHKDGGGREGKKQKERIPKEGEKEAWKSKEEIRDPERASVSDRAGR